MVKESLQDEAPSQDDSFVNVVGICNAAQVGDLERVKAVLKVDPELGNRDLAANNEN